MENGTSHNSVTDEPRAKRLRCKGLAFDSSGAALTQHVHCTFWRKRESFCSVGSYGLLELHAAKAGLPVADHQKHLFVLSCRSAGGCPDHGQLAAAVFE